MIENEMKDYNINNINHNEWIPDEYRQRWILILQK